MTCRSVAARCLMLCLCAIAASSCGSRQDASSPAEGKPLWISGRVYTGRAPASGAEVRVRGQSRVVQTDETGRFRLPVDRSQPHALAIFKEGYYIAEIVAAPSGPGLEAVLKPLPRDAGDDYDWLSAYEGSEESCAHCHQAIVDEWQTSGHAGAAVNPRFLNLYGGTNWQGERGHGWSLLDEYPEGATVCAACHAPAMRNEEALRGDMRHVSGVAAEGIHCDFCHKVRDVPADAIGLAHGRLGTELLRPAEDQLFLGPLKDATRGKEAFASIYQESRYCAACHEGIVFGVHVYSTYSEWLASPAAKEGKTCQSCHMQPTGVMSNFAPDAGGIDRKPDTLASHYFMPGGREAMLRRAVRVTTNVKRDGEDLHLRVELLAQDVGHRVPTGFIDRHLLLVVDPLDGQNRPLDPEKVVNEGPQLGAPAGGQLIGRPGMLLGRVLRDAAGQEPAPFWRIVDETQDSRLVPQLPTNVQFAFRGEVKRARIRLLYRRFWHSVAREKNWPDETITVHDQTIEVTEDASLP